MIGLREVRALEPGQVIWDSGKGAVSGFGARRRQTVGVWYFVKYRTRENRQRWYTIGRHGSPWTPDTAREQAKQVLGEVSKGDDPAAKKEEARAARTVAELCDLYLADAEAGRLLTKRKRAKKASTLATDKGRIERHIKPLLGQRVVTAVISDDVDRFMHAVAEGRTRTRIKTGPRGVARVIGGNGTASRTVGLLGAIFTYAVRKQMRPDNPVRGVLRFADGERDRRLSNLEYNALGDALRKAEIDGVWYPAIAAIRFIALTGWRRGEVLNLRGPEVRLWLAAERDRTKLADTKTGPSPRILSRAARHLLESLPLGEGPVFPASRGTGPIIGFTKYWAQVRKLGNLPADVLPHVLRHSFASLAGDLGGTDLEIAVLLGHRKNTTTSKYHHPGEAILRALADATANRTAELMGEPRPAAPTTDLTRVRSA